MLAQRKRLTMVLVGLVALAVSSFIIVVVLSVLLLATKSVPHICKIAEIRPLWKIETRTSLYYLS